MACMKQVRSLIGDKFKFMSAKCSAVSHHNRGTEPWTSVAMAVHVYTRGLVSGWYDIIGHRMIKL